MVSYKKIRIWILSALVLAVIFLFIYIVLNFIFPRRTMFHNELTSFGEKGPLRFWVQPPAVRNEMRTQELFLDSHLNILVIVVLSCDETRLWLGNEGDGWTGHAHFRYDEALFIYNGHTHRIDRRQHDSLVILGPDGKVAAAPIPPGQASIWYESLTHRVTASFLKDLKKAVASGQRVHDIIQKHDSCQE